MMVKVDTSRVGLVRGYVVYSQWGHGALSIENAKDDACPSVGVAYTFWHRHDENPDAVEYELERLVDFYCEWPKCDGAMYGYEYRDYSR